jgi:biopolymer transport protein ExbD
VKTSKFFLLPALMMAVPVFAQQTAVPVSAAAVAPAAAVALVAAPIAAAADASGKYMLREGTDVNLQFSDDLSSKTSSEGDPVALTLTDDLKVGNVVVAKAGTHAFGEVTKAEKSGMMGKAGELNLRLNYLKVGDNKIQLRGTKGKEGESGTTGAVVLTVLFGPIGLIKHGKNVEIKKGQALHAFVADDVAVPPAS